MVCGAGGQQMVYACRRSGGSDRNPRLTRPGVSQSGSRKTQGTRRSEKEVIEQVVTVVRLAPALMLATKLNRTGQQEELSSMQPYDQGPIATATKPIYSAHNSTINSLNI